MRISDWSSDVCSSDLFKRSRSGTLTGKEQRSAVSQVVQGTASLIFKKALLEAGGDIDIGAGVARHPEISRDAGQQSRSSDERGVGKECFSTCRSPWSLHHYKKNIENERNHNVA